MPAPDNEPQQSWAAWFLDAYANTNIVSHDDSADDSAYETASPTSMSELSNTESSPYGLYVKTGRGGAGNFTWQSQQPADLESQKSGSLRDKRKAAMKIEHIDTSAAVRNAQTRQVSQYARVGRGGAGNMPIIQSNEPQASPMVSTFSRSPISASSPVIVSGRGGAGNFGAARSVSAQAAIEKEQRERVEAEKYREQAELKVSGMLQAPSQAYVGTRRRQGLPFEMETPD